MLHSETGSLVPGSLGSHPGALPIIPDVLSPLWVHPFCYADTSLCSGKKYSVIHNPCEQMCNEKHFLIPTLGQFHQPAADALTRMQPI